MQIYRPAYEAICNSDLNEEYFDAGFSLSTEAQTSCNQVCFFVNGIHDAFIHFSQPIIACDATHSTEVKGGGNQLTQPWTDCSIRNCSEGTEFEI